MFASRVRSIVIVMLSSCVALPGAARTTAPTTAPSVSPGARRSSPPCATRIASSIRSISPAERPLTAMSWASGIRTSSISPDRLPHPIAFAISNPARRADATTIACNGSKAYLYAEELHKYVEQECRADCAGFASLNDQIRDALRDQDLSLYLALQPDAQASVLEEAVTIDRVPDEPLDGRACPVLRIEREQSDLALVVDPQTHLLRQVRVDLKKRLVKAGVPGVGSARMTIDYTRVAPDAAIAENQLAFDPPADATPARLQVAAAAGDGAPHPLQGKRAPDFALADLNGNDVHLADLKDHVVVLDFWATWCGPCREGLPHLSQLSDDLAAQGVKVFAVNLREDKQKAEAFIAAQNLHLSVLLDMNGAVGEKYAVSGIPQTVVIGKGGVVRTVIVGFDSQGGEANLRKAVTEALRGR